MKHISENLNDLPKSMAPLEIKHTTQNGIKCIYLFKNTKHNQDRLVVKQVD